MASLDLPPAYLQKHLLQTLPNYMVPSHLIQIDSLPLSVNGKIDIGRLPQPAGQSSKLNLPSKESMLTLSPVGVHIRDAWVKVLKIADVGVDESFFDVGGHSLLASQVLLEVSQRTGVTISLASFFDNPTILGIVAAVEAAKGSQ